MKPKKRLLNKFCKCFSSRFKLNHPCPDRISVRVSIMICIRNHKWAASFPYLSDFVISNLFTYNHISPAVPWVLCRWCCRVAGTRSEVMVVVDNSQAVFISWGSGGWSKHGVSNEIGRRRKNTVENNLICCWICQKAFILWLPSR